MTKNYIKILQGLSPDEYGDNHAEHVLSIYHSYISSANQISDRRQTANSFFLAVNSGLIGLVGYLDLINKTSSSQLQIFIPISIAGISLCFLWYRIIRSYKGLNSAKFKIIHEIEKFLPLRPYDAEWEAVGRGNNPKLYLPFSQIEIIVPWVFMLLHLFILLRSINC